MLKIFIITGQTATGKTDYALKLAEKYNGELVNCDSRQIYKRLNIITGKDIDKYSMFKKISTLGNFDIGYYSIASLSHGHIARKNNETMKQCNNVKLWLYDIIDPKQYFSSYDYVSCAYPVIKDILSRGKTPIVVGGTYFYLYHLLYNVETQHIKPDWKLRNALNKKSVSELQKIFQKLSLQSFNRLNNSDKNNPQRLIRKIEVITYHKKSNTSSPSLHSLPIPQKIPLAKKLGLTIGIDYQGFRYEHIFDLHKNIENRVEKRIKNGGMREVEELLQQGYSEKDPGLKTIGYTQIIEYLKGKITRKHAVENWISKELQYAKRQYTFMKKDPHIKWRVSYK